MCCFIFLVCFIAGYSARSCHVFPPIVSKTDMAEGPFFGCHFTAGEYFKCSPENISSVVRQTPSRASCARRVLRMTQSVCPLFVVSFHFCHWFHARAVFSVCTLCSTNRDRVCLVGFSEKTSLVQARPLNGNHSYRETEEGISNIFLDPALVEILLLFSNTASWCQVNSTTRSGAWSTVPWD